MSLALDSAAVDRLLPLSVKGRFVNPAVTQARKETSFRDVLKWRRERVKPPKTFHVPRVESPSRIAAAPEKGVRATWAGHSSVLLQLDGRNYLTDPVWSERVGSVVKRLTPPGVPFEGLPRIDALLLSHNHYDHLDAGTLARLPKDTPAFVPTGVGAWLRKRGWTRVVERSWWESWDLAGHRVTCVPAQHFSGRTPWDRDRTLWCGWVVQGTEGSSAWFGGDTGYFRGFKEIGAAFPRLDLALVPAGAYEPRWFMGPVHVSPDEAAQAFVESGARVMLPIHWGTFQLADEPLDAPPGILREWWKANGLDASRLLLPALGESVDVPPR